jgi:ubiquinone/menaquinone biosynthesis C-methylase UbiE
MEKDRVSIARQLFAHMALKPGERVLQLSCGEGWATRVAAEAVSGGTGMAAGLDISQDRIAQARAEARDVENALFAVGAAEEIPWRDDFFDGIFSIESFSGNRNQESVLREAHRVLVPGGRLCFVAGCGEEALHRQLLHTEGFVGIVNEKISGSANAEGREDGREGALLWTASKP